MPKWIGGSHWRRHLKGMYLLQEYPAGTPLKWVPGDKKGHPQPAAVCPSVLQAWFDPRTMSPPPRGWLGVLCEAYTIADSGKRVRGKLHTLGKVGPAHIMAFDSTIGDQRVMVLLDSGASSNFMSKKVQGSGLKR